MHRGQIDNQPEAPVLIPISDKNANAGENENDFSVSPSEMLVSMSSSTLEEYYLAMAIATLMKIIRDPTLSQHHTMVVQAVTFTFKSLGIKCVPYISQVSLIFFFVLFLYCFFVFFFNNILSLGTS